MRSVEGQVLELSLPDSGRSTSLARVSHASLVAAAAEVLDRPLQADLVFARACVAGQSGAGPASVQTPCVSRHSRMEQFCNTFLLDMHVNSTRSHRAMQQEQSTVCHLQRALYGLRQAPRQWHACLKQALEHCGFSAAVVDPRLFVHDDRESTIFLPVYVDNILTVVKPPRIVTWAANTIQDAFDTRNLGAAQVYLGTTIARDRRARTLMPNLARTTKDQVRLGGCQAPVCAAQYQHHAR